MAIKQAQYKITLQSGEDIYHFETNDNMVNIIDANKNVLGTFKEFGMEGKVVTSGSVKDLKITGIYKIKGVTGLPTGYAIDKISILSVKAVGKIGTPELVSYDLISQTGEIYQNTMLGTTLTGWTSGGTTLKNTITNLTNAIGDITALKTTSKANLVNALNEIKLSHDVVASDLATLKQSHSSNLGHNHDSRYLNKSGDTITGHLVVANDRAFQGLKTSGTSGNLMGYNKNNNIVAGETSSNFEIAGKEITFNGNKVWHEDNDGANSGLDADKLGGIGHANYARKDVEAKFLKNIFTDANLFVGSQLYFGKDYNNRVGGITSSANGTIGILNGKSAFHTFLNTGIMQSLNSHELLATSREVSLKFKLNNTDGGIGLYRSNSSKNLGFYNWSKSKQVGFINSDNSAFYFNEPIAISGRRLFLQSSAPTGTIPTGSIWIS